MPELHKLTDIDEVNRQANCSVCGLVKVKLRDSRYTNPKARYRCKTVYKNNNDKIKYPYKKHKKEYCDKCGFVAEHTVQLDVDHIDGNNNNNNLDNLQTLCANCHRLKTLLNKDGAYKHSF
jgi:5-methylcytosine-specific restriction endonuclease McrA